MRVVFTEMEVGYNTLLFGKVKEFDTLNKIDDYSYSVYLDIILLALHPDSPMYNAFRRNKSWDIVVENSMHKNAKLVKGFHQNKYFKDAVSKFYELIKHDDKNNYVILIDKEVSTIEDYLQSEREQRERDIEFMKRYNAGDDTLEVKFKDVTPPDKDVAFDFGGEEAPELPEIKPMINYVRERSECLEIIVKLLRMRDDFEERASLRKVKKGQEKEEEYADVKF